MTPTFLSMTPLLRRLFGRRFYVVFTLTCIISIVKVGYLFEQPTVARASKKRLYSGGIPLVWSYDITSELLRFGITREQFSGCATDPGYSLETEYLHHFTHNSELVTSSVQNAEAFFIPHKLLVTTSSASFWIVKTRTTACTVLQNTFEQS